MIKKTNEKDRPITLNENKKRSDFEKIKSPSSNNIKGKPSNQLISNVNMNNYRSEDDRINLKQNINPFNKQPNKPESREKELSKQLRMNSTNKKMKMDPNNRMRK